MNILQKALSEYWIPRSEVIAFCENYQREFSYYGFKNRYEWLSHKLKEANERGDRESSVKYQYKLKKLDDDLRRGKGAFRRGLRSLKANAMTALRKVSGNDLDKSEEWYFKGGRKRQELNRLRDEWDNNNDD